LSGELGSAPPGKLSAPEGPRRETSYDRVAKIYDGLAALYSGGGIARAKRAHHTLLEEGDRVLYLGAGTGEEAHGASKRGAKVTILDLSESMIEGARRRFSPAEASNAEFLVADARRELAAAPFDVVVAPFFLNVFAQEELEEVLHQVTRHVRSGGLFISVDFRAPSENPLLRFVQKTYYLPPLALFRICTGNPWHDLYDYEALMRRAVPPAAIEERTITRALGLPVLETIAWRLS